VAWECLSWCLAIVSLVVSPRWSSCIPLTAPLRSVSSRVMDVPMVVNLERPGRSAAPLLVGLVIVGTRTYARWGWCCPGTRYDRRSR
jgi:hypothetical protein